jgi:poly-beta-hydroxyalkanoate depolymerase
MYTFWKRSAPPASMDIFNAPSRENCTVRRERTNTPLQALVTMNDPQYVEAARHLAERMMHEPTARVDFLSKQVLGRTFDVRERQIVQQAYADYLTHYKANPADAKKLIATGASTPDAKLPAPELAAWTMVANQVLNLDEVLNK